MLRSVGVAVAVILSPLVSIGGAIALWRLVNLDPALVFFFPGFELHDWRDLMPFALAACALVAVPVFCLIVEAVVIGFRQSGLRRLLVDASPSTVNDLFYLLLRSTGATQAVIFILSLGVGFGAAHWLEQRFSFALLAQSPYAAQFGALAAVHTFLFYWAHRFMHLAGLWQIHKVHHSAHELNVITPLRNHPLDGLIMLIVYAGPLAALGVTPLVASLYFGCNAAYQCLAHSSIPWRSRWLEVIIITPAAHRLHHSADPQHWNTNFGILTLWDWLFGTYLSPDTTAKTLGVDDPIFNSGRPVKELWTVFVAWLRSMAPASLPLIGRLSR